MGEAAGVQRHHARVDIIARKEIAGVLENQFVKVAVILKQRHLECTWFGFERIRHKRADDEASGNERPTAQTTAGDSDGSSKVGLRIARVFAILLVTFETIFKEYPIDGRETCGRND